MRERWRAFGSCGEVRSAFGLDDVACCRPCHDAWETDPDNDGGAYLAFGRGRVAHVCCTLAEALAGRSSVRLFDSPEEVLQHEAHAGRAAFGLPEADAAT